MKSASRRLAPLIGVYILITSTAPSSGMISVRALKKEEAKENYGITMHARRNGYAGIKVRLEFNRNGRLENFTCAELRMEDARGRQVFSTQLRPAPCTIAGRRTSRPSPSPPIPPNWPGAASSWCATAVTRGTSATT